ncbi:MAG TPA: glycosyltransferase [Thermoanaerobaculia bacterium]|nr:glycosyltransferase [Thermoanaerobaculia bacterium]
MLRGATIVCLSSIDWAFNWQVPQEVASAFAASGNRVLYIENTGVRRPSIRDVGRLRDRLRNWWRASGGVKATDQGPEILSPLLLPFPYARGAVAINERILLRAIRAWIGRDERRPLIVITFLPTPLARAAIHGLAPDLTLYYCADRMAETSVEAGKLRESEPLLLAEAGLVLTTSHGLQKTAAAIAKRVEYLPCGVRSAEFASATRSGAGRPSAFEGLTGPIIGFTGTLRDEIDVALLTELARLASDLNFVFVGPVAVDVTRLRAHKNVRFLGAVPHADVVTYTANLDAGILPYLLTDYTADVMPVKLKEYLAAGLPIVSTHLPEICRFADQHPGVISFASDAATFARALRHADADKSLASVEHRMAIARHYDWSEQMSQMSDWIESELAVTAASATDRVRSNRSLR